MKAIETTASIFLKMLVYGQPGSTKTRTVGSAALDARTAPALLLDIGGNPLSLRDYRPGPKVLQIDEIKDFNMVYAWLKAGQPANHPMVTMYKCMPGYKTVIIDGVTDLQRYSVAQVTGNQRVGPGDIPTSTQIQHHGQVLAQMTNLARAFFKLDMNVLVTALEKETQDANGQLMYSPLMTGQVAGEVAGYAYTVMRLVHRARVAKNEARSLKILEDPTDQTVAVGYIQPSGKTVAKDQSGIGVPYIIDPSVTKILDLIAENSTVTMGNVQFTDDPDALVEVENVDEDNDE